MLCTLGRYFVLIFRILTVFDIIPLELVRFQNSRYSVSLCSFSCPACPFSLSLSYFKCKNRKRLRSFSSSTVFILNHSTLYPQHGTAHHLSDGASTSFRKKNCRTEQQQKKLLGSKWRRFTDRSPGMIPYISPLSTQPFLNFIALLE